MATSSEAMPRRRSGAGPWVALALTCAALVAVDITLFREALLTLGQSHRASVEADATSTLYEMPGALPKAQRARVRRTDEVLVTGSEAAVIQSTVVWLGSGGGEVLARGSGLYGVDRATRANIAGYGDEARGGAFAPPPGAPRGRLVLWDSFHPGPLVFEDEALEVVEGIALRRYRLASDGSAPVDATVQFAASPLVPERYRVRARVEAASLLVEPLTGTIVDREQRGVAWFVAADDPTPLGEVQRWSWRYSADDRARLIAEARGALRRFDIATRWAPGGLALLGLAALVMAWRRRGHGGR